jgi:putative ABC transport system permease protein
LTLMLATGVVFGLAPAVRVSSPDLVAAINQGSSGAGSHRVSKLQSVLVAAQVAVCMMLMIGAGLLLRGLYSTHRIDAGFEYRNVAFASYNLRSAGYDNERAAVFQRRLLQQVKALPGVEAAAYAWTVPLTYTGFRSTAIRLPDQPADQLRPAAINVVSPGYFSLVDLPIVRGRTFTDAELTDDAGVTIVTESTARNLWPGRDPIGQTVVWRGADQPVELRVVGVARDAQVTLVGQIDPYYVYVPAGPTGLGRLSLLVKSRANFATIATDIRSAVRGLDRGVVVNVSSLESNIAFWRGLSGAVTAVAGFLGALALVLAAVGIYGVVAYFVGQRFREIGIRLALGAKPGRVLALVLRRTLLPVAIGAGIGIAGAGAASDVLSSVLFGVSPADPLGLGGAVLFVLSVALAAGALAGSRATRVDPMVTLRYE